MDNGDLHSLTHPHLVALPLYSVITNLQGSGVINRGIKEYGQTTSGLFVIVVFELPLFILFLLSTNGWVLYGISRFISLSLALIKTEKFRKCRANLWKNNRCCPKGMSCRRWDTIARPSSTWDQKNINGRPTFSEG